MVITTITNLSGDPQRLQHASPEPFVQLAEQLLSLSQRSFDHSYCFIAVIIVIMTTLENIPGFLQSFRLDSTTFFVATVLQR
jgi:hypothetical protein